MTTEPSDLPSPAENGPDADTPSAAADRGAPVVPQDQVPPATMTTLVSMFSTQAMVGLGLLANPMTGKPEPQLHLARHFIDLLGVLETKTQGNLTSDEAKLLEMSLHELRMAFVQVSRK